MTTKMTTVNFFSSTLNQTLKIRQERKIRQQELAFLQRDFDAFWGYVKTSDHFPGPVHMRVPLG